MRIQSSCMKIFEKSFWLEVEIVRNDRKIKKKKKKRIGNVTKRLVSILPLFFDRDDDEHVDDDDGSSSGTSWHDLSSATFPRIRCC